MVYDWLEENHPEFLQKLSSLGVKYIKVAPEEDDPSSALGRSWKSMYNVKTKEEAEKEMEKQNSTWEWLPNGDCRIISQTLPAVKVCTNGNYSFFNQMIAAYTGWIDKRNDPTKALVFGDDSPMDNDVMMKLAEYYDGNKCSYRWTPGKFVIIDNSVTAHSRQPFNGTRKVFAAIGKWGTQPVMDKTTHLVLKSGDKMPSVGLGLWKMPKEECSNAVYRAV